MTGDQKEKLKNLLEESEVLFDEPMKLHTTFRIGGNAECFVRIQNIEELSALVEFCRREDLPFFFMGKGSNLLVSDNGIAGVVATFGDGMSDIIVKDDMIIAEGGASLSAVASHALQKGLTGFEFAAGIPGSVGGAVRMNAGAYGGEMSQVVGWVRVLTPDGNIKTILGAHLEFGYRTSILKDVPYIVLSCGIQLMPGDEKQIRITMLELGARRREKQPLEYPSAGSTFKRPEGYFAGKLIEEAGCRGLSVGGAKVSEKHCGFIINENDATAKDVSQLIEEVRKRVYENSGILLEPEIIFMGE
ncbi:MAG: UDP-N-acetylmuramate dehydrogenase [Lachnospiraceae bacterium]|nr:UDP-N-acetylmuramate dehydrogenase [Lachnospiraceae bacterium]